MANLKFRSPLRKLVTFFEASRDNWKAKCQQVKYQFKLLKRRFENLERNRDLWQQRYQVAESGREQLQAQREHLHAQNQKLQAQVEASSQKGGTCLLACQHCQRTAMQEPANRRLSKASHQEIGTHRSRTTTILWDRSRGGCR